MKDIVQFRPLPKNPTSKLIIDHESSNYILKGIHAWIISVLAERVKPLKDINSIYSICSVLSTDRLIKMDYLKQLWSTWLFKRPQPIHVLWFPEFSVKSKFSYSHQHAPLVLSALSVTYTGRVRFWIVLNETLNQNYTISDNNWPITTSSINTVSDLLISINCSIKSHFIIFTPEGKCYSFGSNEREYLSYENLGFLLHYLYPSADDFLWILVLVTTVLVLINGAIEAGRILLLVIHSFSMDYNLVEKHRSGSTGTRRSALARTVIRLARQGWTSHIPNFNTSQHSIYNDRSFDNHYRLTNQNQPIHENQMNASSSSQYLPSTNMRSFISSHILEWIKIFFLDLFSAYFLLLLAILPLLNLLSLPYSLPIVNLTLWLLRSFILSSPMINLRLSILSGHLNWYHSCSFILTFWLFIVFLSSCVLLKYEKLNGRLTSNNSHSRRLSRLNPILVRERLNQIPPDQLWDELSRLIIQSDIELRSGSTDSATSSTLESESRYHHSCNNQSKSTNESLLSNIELPQINYGENAEVVEGNRLLRRLRRLYNILSQQTDHLTSTSMNPIASFSSDLYHQGNGENDELLNHKTAAHMYTWNCLRSLGNNNSNTVRSNVGVNPSQYRSHTRKSFSVTKQPTNHVMDTSYEAEDECEDPTSDDDKRSKKASSPHLHSHLHSNRLSHPITSSSNSSSTSDPNNSDREPYLGNSSVPSREISKRTNLISTSSVLSTSSSSSYISSNDVSFTNSSNDWPSWVVPCKECVVCWQRFRPGVRLSALPCGHGFHEHCIRKWLDTGAFECPVCRWPAYAPHLRQQCQMIGQLINAVQNTIEFAKNSPNRTNIKTITFLNHATFLIRPHDAHSKLVGFIDHVFSIWRIMEPLSKTSNAVVNENNNDTEIWNEDANSTYQDQNTLPSTIQSVLDDDDNNQLITEQPFKKPKLINMANLDLSQNKQGKSDLSSIFPVIENSSLASSSSADLPKCHEPITPAQCGVDSLTNTSLLEEEEPVEDDEDEVDVEEDEEEEEEDDEDDSTTVLEDADTESVVSDIISSALQQEKEARKTEDRKLLALLAHFDEEQLNRFETFRRATLAKSVVKRLIQSIAPCSISQNVVIAMAGLTKVFIGELVEEGK
ncbi:Transcription initiation factor TFIID subunit 11 [Schistosoma japonicum]|nr:Transcription initiation factor TFIID subunit 11 [Schistosoma japonicum]